MYPTQSAARAAELYSAAGEHPANLLVGAHDGMIAKLAAARAAIADGRIEDRFELTSKVARVIDVLEMALDHEAGGEIADNLARLYTYFGRRLHDLNIRNDAAICDELIERLGELRAAWQAALADDTTRMGDVAAGASFSA